ncbi:nephrin isoform X3 [Linepithema humile]|uniref:nephrin isoform X3 n=1 Tax=Linepithema humile TaxID=83485 RepID=UPI0006233DC8|nr:PREDICTED: nephrin isoform X3 [Linepithema humile]
MCVYKWTSVAAMKVSGVIAEKKLFGMRLFVLIAACLTSAVKGEAVQQHFRIRPSNSSVLEGGEVVIPCEVTNRVGAVQWVKDGFAYVIQPNGDIVGHPRLKMIGDQNAGIYNLRITDASLTDDGEYECQVGRYLRIKPIRASAHLIVTSPPRKVEISSHPNNREIEVKVGESRRLECIVRSAKPAASIIWYRGNVQIKGGDTTTNAISIEGDKDAKPGETSRELLKYDTHGSITIVPTADDNGMDYTCEASHEAIPIDRPMRATIRLSVFYPPGQPYIEGYTEGETVQRGQNVELSCRSRGGNPPADIIWYRNGERISSFTRRENTFSENVLSFIARAEDEKARYRCEVSNVMSVQPMKVHVDLTVLFAPAGVTITGPTEAKADDQVHITCMTENSNPPADIKWTVDGHNFESNSSKTEPAPNGGWITTSNVTFSINRKSRSIVVICHASNAKLTENVVGTHTINVIYPPSKLSVTGYEEGTTIVAGTVLKLMCIATAGNPLATLTWYKNDRKVSLGTVRQRNHAVSSELAILVNASDNNAHVRCEATNSATEIPLLKVLVLKVNFPPERVKINREPQDFHAGQEGRIICESSSSNPAAEMSWWKNGIPVTGTRNGTKPGLHGGYLSFVELSLDLTEDMNGEVYTCEAKNTELGRSIHDATTLDVLYKPIFSPLDPFELTGLEGEPFVISVSARGNPNTTEYTWTRDGLPIVSSNRRVTAHGSTLNITKLDRHDAGTYICEALNKEGTTFYQLNLTVQYPAKIKRISSSGIVYPPGIEAKLFCEIDGSPIGDEFVTWQKVGSNLEPGRYSTSFVNRTSYLHIERPSQQDVGEYLCKVNNGIGNVTSDPILFITNFKPEMTNTPLTRKAAANKGISVHLYCKARGSPLPRFSWIFNRKTLSPNTTENKYSITHSDLSELYSETVLTIHNVKAQDYGKYECRAQNKVGQSSEDILLDVTSPPDKPSDLEVYNVTHDSVTLIWKRGFDGGLPTSYQIRWRQALDYEARYYYLDISPGENKATISGLSLGTYYVFSVKAINEKGDSGFLPDLVKVQTLREAPPTELTSSENSSSYIIVIIITVSASACLLIAATIVFATIKSKKKAQRAGINKSQTADMYAPSTVNGDTMTGELSSMSDEKSDVNFDANDYVQDEGRKTAASTYLIDQTMQDYGKGGLEMQVHQGTLGRRSNHMQTSMNMDSPPQRTTASGTLSVSKSSYIGNPSPAPPNDVSFYSVEMDNGGRGYMSYDGNPSPAPPPIGDPSGGPYYPTSLGSTGHIMGGHLGAGTGTLTRTRTLPRPVPPPDVTVMTAGTKSPIPPSVPPPPATFARAGPNNAGPHPHAHTHPAPPPPPCQSHPLSTFAATPTYSDIDGHLV